MIDVIVDIDCFAKILNAPAPNKKLNIRPHIPKHSNKLMRLKFLWQYSLLHGSEEILNDFLFA